MPMLLLLRIETTVRINATVIILPVTKLLPLKNQPVAAKRNLTGAGAMSVVAIIDTIVTLLGRLNVVISAENRVSKAVARRAGSSKAQR